MNKSIPNQSYNKHYLGNRNWSDSGDKEKLS